MCIITLRCPPCYAFMSPHNVITDTRLDSIPPSSTLSQVSPIDHFSATLYYFLYLGKLSLMTRFVYCNFHLTNYEWLIHVFLSFKNLTYSQVIFLLHNLMSPHTVSPQCVMQSHVSSHCHTSHYLMTLSCFFCQFNIKHFTPPPSSWVSSVGLSTE